MRIRAQIMQIRVYKIFKFNHSPWFYIYSYNIYTYVFVLVLLRFILGVNNLYNIILEAGAEENVLDVVSYYELQI